jgi:predicted phage terminase large subunit-like protein
LLRYACGREDAENLWYFNRCREVQAKPDGHLDLWAREHGKSSIITFALTIQDSLNDPEVTFGIFSHTRPIAKGFLRQIKREFEANDRLKEWFPDVLWPNPQKDAPKWSEDDGIVVKRQGNPKECTVEAWGLVDGQPTGKHFRRRVYDDVVTRESVTTPEMMAKTTEAWELSDNLGTEGGAFRVVGTRYHFSDTYGDMLRRKVVEPRIYPCTIDGTEDGEPVLMSRETLAEKRRMQGPYTFGAQMLLNPKGDDSQGFKREWLRYTNNPRAEGMNVYLLCDPANSKRKTNDYTSMWVIGLGQDENYVALDMLRDRLNLAERTRALFELHRKWRPLAVGYEHYSMQADIQHIQDYQDRVNYRFNIVELGSQVNKKDRIKRLIPLFEQGRIYLPRSKYRTTWDGKIIDLVEVFVEEEYSAFPVSTHDDMLDCLARIVDPDFRTEFPLGNDDSFDDEYTGDNRSSVTGY